MPISSELDVVCNQTINQVLQQTAEMVRGAVDGDWVGVQKLESSRRLGLEKLVEIKENFSPERLGDLAEIIESNKQISALIVDAKSDLKLEQQELLRGRQATVSYQKVQEER
jgi:hypothetical protein